MKFSKQPNYRKKSLFKTANESHDEIKNNLINRLKKMNNMKEDEKNEIKDNSFEKYIRKKNEFSTVQHLGKISDIKKRGSSPDLSKDKIKLLEEENCNIVLQCKFYKDCLDKIPNFILRIFVGKNRKLLSK